MIRGQNFGLECVTFKKPVRNLSEDGQMSLEFRKVVQPGNIWGAVYCKGCFKCEEESMGPAKQ